jgi:membrane fusion protein, copper/silver efflux system
MKKIIKNKTTILLLLVTLAVGALIGWLARPAPRADGQDHGDSSTVSTGEIWTCSMHPQIRQEGPGKCPLCGMDLIPVTLTSAQGHASPFILELSPEAVALANIQTTAVGAASAGNELRLSGTIRANEERLSTITAKFPGRIENLYVSVTGQAVRRGERLAALYSPDLIAAQRELQEAARTRDIFPELYQAARQKLRLWGLSDQQIARIESANQLITNFDIYADAAGVVTERMVAVGDYVSTGSPLFQVANLSTVWAVLDAFETDLGQVNRGAPVTVTVPGAGGQSFNTTVQFVTPTLGAGTRAVEVRTELPNPGQALKPGMFVNATLQAPAPAEQGGVAVPRTAVLWTGQRSVVYVRVPNRSVPAFEMREVVLGPRVGEQYLIQSGVSAGDEVVTNGVFAVDGAAQLSGNYSMMTAVETKTLDVRTEFRQQLSRLLDGYLQLKNALVEDNAADARSAADAFYKALDRTDMALLDGRAHEAWMQLQPTLAQSADHIRNTGDIGQQRSAFVVFSEHMIEAVETFGTEHALVYKQHCPMANSDRGAYWLSVQEEIRNPYYGASMLTCGDLKQTYRQGQGVPRTTAPPAAPAGQGHVH